jgi:superfamily I DNA/RNA helicase
MQNSKDEKIKILALFLMEAAKISKTKDIREMIDIFIGNESIEIEIDKNKVKYFSPLKKYYFDNQDKSKDYFFILESLRRFIEELSEYFGKNKNDKIKINKIEDFINDYKENEINISVEKSSLNHDEGVNLLTAHGSKGLEFKHVFIINADEKN